MASRIVKDVRLVYGYLTMAEMERNKKKRYQVAPQLFYIYGMPNSKALLERVQKKHMYMKEADAYLVGKITQYIWKEE